MPKIQSEGKSKSSAPPLGFNLTMQGHRGIQWGIKVEIQEDQLPAGVCKVTTFLQKPGEKEESVSVDMNWTGMVNMLLIPKVQSLCSGYNTTQDFDSFRKD